MDRLGNVFDCNPQVKLIKEKEYPLIDIDSITIGKKYPVPKEPVKYIGQSASKFCSGDTIMARITPCLENGKIAMVKTDSEACIGSTELFVFRGKNGKSINEYVYYFMKQDWIRNYATNSMTGASGRQRANLDFIKKIQFEFPDCEVQKKIVNYLIKYDELIENNNKRISILEQMAEEIYKEWFIRFRFPGHEKTEFENGIPKGWEVKKVRDCVNRKKFGITYKAEEVEKEGEIIVIDQSKDEYLGFHSNEPSHKADLDKPILLFGDHSCKTKIMIKEFSLGENVIPYVSNNNDKINNYYLYYATNKLLETEEYKRHWSRFCGFKIFIPPIDLQNIFIKHIKIFEQEKELLWCQNQKLIKQRDLLLPRLMSGKLEIK